MRSLLVPALILAGLAAAPGSGAASPRTSPEAAAARRFERALRAFDRRRFAESRQLLEQLAREHPEKGLYWFNLANACLKLQDWPAAIQGYRRVIELRSPLAIPAGLYLAKASRAQGDLEAAQHWIGWAGAQGAPPHLERAIRDEALAIQDEAMRAGIEAYQNAAFPRAIQRFELAGQPGADAQVATQAAMMKALALLRTDQSERALKQFEHLSQEAAANSVLREFARDLSRLEREAARDDADSWLFAELAVGYNSNLFGVSGSPGRAILPWVIGGGLKLKDQGRFSLRVGDSLNWEEAVGLPASRLIRNAFWAQLRYQSPGWLILFSPQLELGFLGPDPYLARPSSAFSLQRVLGADRLGAVLTAGYSSPASTGFEYLRGAFGSLRLSWLHSNGPWAAGPNLSLARENLGALELGGGSLPLAYTGYGPGFSGFWVPSQRFELSGTASYQWRDFTGTSQPGDIHRFDRVFTLFARGSYKLRRELAHFVELDSSVNASTLDQASVEDKNYARFIVVTGVSWDLL